MAVVAPIEIHDDAALVETMMTSGEIGFHHKTEIPLIGLHLQDRGIVVAEMVIGALPQVRVRRGGDLDAIAADDVVLRLACPRECTGIHDDLRSTASMYVYQGYTFPRLRSVDSVIWSYLQIWRCDSYSVRTDFSCALIRER